MAQRDAALLIALMKLGPSAKNKYTITITITITIAITITTITITITIAITITTILTKGAWLHVDASYAGSAFICPEFRHLMKGVKNKKPEHFFSKVAKRVLLYFLRTFSDRVRPELQHEPKQVDAGQLRLQHHVVCV